MFVLAPKFVLTFLNIRTNDKIGRNMLQFLMNTLHTLPHHAAEDMRQ